MIYKRMLPPTGLPAGGVVSQPVNGRVYNGVSSSTPVDVPAHDAEILAQFGGYGDVENKWSLTSPCPAGPTADRPTKLPNESAPGFFGMYLDTTLGFIISWNAPRNCWINPATGAAV